MRQWARRWGIGLAGWVITIIGIILFPLPGPGLLIMVVGLALLAEQYDWAARGVDRLKRRALLEAAKGVRTQFHAAVSVLVALVLTASGGLWVWEPPQPAWWVLPHWTWLPGGLWSGISQALSGLVTLAVVLFAYQRYHGHPERVAELAGEVREDDAAAAA